MGFKSRRHHADRLATRTPTKCWKIIRAIDVFSRYALTYTVSSPTAVNTAKVIIDIMTRHANLHTIMITDKGSFFVSNVIHKTADVQGITLRHATTKLAQTIWVLEKTQATIKTSLRMSWEELRKQGHKYLPLTILNYNRMCHKSVGCEHRRIFHGRVLYIILDHKLGLNGKTGLVPATGFADELLRKTQSLYDKTKKNLRQLYIRYKNFREKKQKPHHCKKKISATIYNLKQVIKAQKTVSRF